MRIWLILAATLGMALLGGCADMKDQPHHEPLEKSTFFPDDRSSRPLVEGTVARGHLQADDRIYRGVGADGKFVQDIPVPVDAAVLARGKNRFEIYCTPCHGRRGDGQGMVVQRGYMHPPSYHTDRLRSVPDGYIYDVISHGFGKMSSYAAQVRPLDRWAIVAYVRTLQLSQYSDLASVDPAIRARLMKGEVVDTRQPAHPEEEGHDGSGH
jgi:mono/diheme cytochrome c family protein